MRRTCFVRKPRAEDTQPEVNKESIKKANSLRLVRDEERITNQIKWKFFETKCFSNWIQNPAEFEKNADVAFNVLSNYLADLNIELDDSELRHNALEILCKKLTQSFLAVYLKKFLMAESLIPECLELIFRCKSEEDPLINPECAPGVMYCFRSLRAFFYIEKHTEGLRSRMRDLRFALGSLNEAAELKEKGTVGLLAMKQSFLRMTNPRSFGWQCRILRQIIKLDPNNGEWYYRMYKVMKLERNQHSWTTHHQNEIQVIVKAAELCPNHPRIILSLYTVLAEIGVRNGYNSQKVVDIGIGVVFHSSAEIRQYLKSKARKYIIMDPVSAETNIMCARINLMELPSPYLFLDVSYAKLALDRAMMYHSLSSKSNNEYGLYCLIAKRNTWEAIQYFRKAVILDTRNFCAVRNLLLTSLVDHGYNTDMMEYLFNQEEQNEHRSKGNRGELAFIKGLHYYAMGEENARVMAHWLECHKLCGHLLLFKNFQNMKIRFGLTDDRFGLRQVAAAVYPPEDDDSLFSENQKALLLLISETVKNCESKRSSTSENTDESDLESLLSSSCLSESSESDYEYEPDDSEDESDIFGDGDEYQLGHPKSGESWIFYSTRQEFEGFRLQTPPPSPEEETSTPLQSPLMLVEPGLESPIGGSSSLENVMLSNEVEKPPMMLFRKAAWKILLDDAGIPADSEYLL